MSRNTCQSDKHAHIIFNNDSVKIRGHPNLESQSSNTQESENATGIEEHPPCSQESQVSIEHDGSDGLGLSFELAYKDFEEELRQRAKCRKLLKKETERMDGYDKTSATKK